MNKTLVTLLIGIGIGILLAPDKGSETWKKLRESLDDYKDRIGDEVEELGEKAKKTVKKDS
jgi:gas vesicle protein